MMWPNLSRTKAIILAAVLALITTSTAQAKEPRGLVGSGYGVQYFLGPGSSDPICGTPGNECGIDLITCAPGQSFTQSRGVYRFIDGVCDDASSDPNEHCGGKFTALTELCLINLFSAPSGGFLSAYQVGQGRICYDPTASGDCAGTPPSGEVIGQYDVRNNGGGFSSSGINTGSGEATLIKGTDATFFFNGKTRRLRKPKEGYLRATVEAPSPSNSCGNLVSPPVIGGCGLSFEIISKPQ